MRYLFLVLTICAAQMALGQETDAPTPQQAGSPRGENTGEYNVVDSVETGYRFAVVTGSLGTYRADVNYGNGIRLLSSNLTVNSRDGHGKWFDTLVLTTQGLGNDPYQSALLRIEKNKLYRYDLLWRLDDFYDPALPIAAGYHLMDTTRRMQDHNLTLFPQAKIKLRFGYTGNVQEGPALSSINSVSLFGTYGSEFPLFMNVRRATNEFRLGADVEFAGFTLTLMHTWNYFKDDSTNLENGAISGDNPGAGVTLSQFQRAEPYRGTNPSWFANLTRSAKTWSMNARATYVAGRGDYLVDENAFGSIPTGAQNEQIFVTGNAARPSITGDLSASWFPGTNLTVVNNSSVTDTRSNGNSVFEQFDPATQAVSYFAFRYLAIRTVANATDIHYRLRKWLSLYTGYHYSARRIGYIEGYEYPLGTPFGAMSYQQENHVNAGLFGVRIKPIQAMTINLQTEIGRAPHPLAPLSEANYQTLGARWEYRVRKLTLNASYKENYNGTSVSLSSYSSRARNYGAGASWIPVDWFSLDASYAKLHLDTVAGIQFFVDPNQNPTTGMDAIYISNIHAGTLGARFTLLKRVDVYAGYSITKDVGDGRGSASNGVTDPILQAFVPFQTFPLTYQSPMARVSVRMLAKLRWNAGWQYYNYHEQFGLFGFYEGYHANTGYTSMTWSF